MHEPHSALTLCECENFLQHQVFKYRFKKDYTHKLIEAYFHGESHIVPSCLPSHSGHWGYLALTQPSRGCRLQRSSAEWPPGQPPAETLGLEELLESREERRLQAAASTAWAGPEAEESKGLAWCWWRQAR